MRSCCTLFCLLLWLALAAGCQLAADGRAAPEAMASLDDVTNGLTQTENSASSDSFFHDGEGGDVRGRSENSFGRTGKPGAAADSPPPPAEAPPAGRMMVYQGQVQVEVARVDEAIARFTEQVQGWGGYLSTRRDAAVTVRVPATRFPEAMAALRSYGRVLGESMQAQDVTKQHLDLSIRLENAQKSRERLLALLEKADKVEDMLKIEEQLRRLTEEIERMAGELKFLADQVAMSTVTAEFQGIAAVTPDRRRRTPSRFAWINAIGLEGLRRNF